MLLISKPDWILANHTTRGTLMPSSYADSIVLLDPWLTS
jgi:hypothetical protein